MRTRPKILVIDDQWGRADDPMIEENYGALPFQFLLESAEGDDGQYNSEIALRRVERESGDLAVILLDVMFGRAQDRLGLEILKCLRRKYPVLPILMLTSLGPGANRELVVECIENGANEYVEKAPDSKGMDAILKVYTDPNRDQALYGSSESMRSLRSSIARLAFSGHTSTLITGESGTGKELIARALYRQGPKRNGPFVAKNCAHSELQLLDSELFGHERGAFTGASERRTGLVEEANGGVLFLDEISDMPLELQAKLLRVLETRTFRRLGDNTDLKSEFQLLCATNRDPHLLIQQGRLREDLFYRIATVSLYSPPLRERAEDIPALADLFIKRVKGTGGESYPGDRFTARAIGLLQSYRWPGNVRELRNVVERAIILSRREAMDVDCLPPEIARPSKTVFSGVKALSSQGTEDDPLAGCAKQRLMEELALAVEVKERVQRYKGQQWKAEFMRKLYPYCKAQNAKGFNDLLRRLTKAPWGDPTWQQDERLRLLIESLYK